MPSLTSSGSPTFGGSRCALDTTDRLQLPANLFDETQGWLAFRVKMGFASTGGAAAPRAFEWADGANGDLQCGYDTGVDQWYMYRDNPGGSNQINSATQSFASGDDLTIVVAWRAGQISISINGANFITDATAQHIPTLVGTFDIGNSPGANRSIESSYWWAAGGNGTLSNADAATIHAFGNGEPDDHRARRYRRRGSSRRRRWRGCRYRRPPTSRSSRWSGWPPESFRCRRCRRASGCAGPWRP